MHFGSGGPVVGGRKLKIAVIAVSAAVLALMWASGTFAQPGARRCDASYCYERICAPGSPSCRYVPNRVCNPTTKQECTTQNVKKCHKVPSNTCSSQAANSCHSHLKRVCGYASRYRTYAAEELSYYRRIPHLRPRHHYAASPRCHLQVVRECSGTPRQACRQAYKDECSYVPERSCHNRVTQDCRDEPKYVCEQGPDKCYEQPVPRASGYYPPPQVEKTPAPYKPEEVPPPPYRQALPAPAPPKPAPLEPPAAESNPAPPAAPKNDPGMPTRAPDPEQRRELVIDVPRLLAPIAGGLAAFGMLLLFASRRRKSEAKADKPIRPFHIAYRGKPDPGTQAISAAPVGRHITLRTVPGQRKVDITLG